MNDSKYDSRKKNSRSRSKDRHNRDNRRRSPDNRTGRRSEREESPKRRYDDDRKRSGRDRDDHKYGSRHKSSRSKSRSRSRERHNRGDRRRSPENRTDRRSEREESARHGDMQVEKERTVERTHQRRNDRSKSRSRSKDRRRDNNYYNNNRSRNNDQRRDTRSDNYRTDYSQRRNDSSYATDRKGDRKSYYSKSWKNGSEASTKDNPSMTSAMKILTHPETLDYPYCRYHITEEGVDFAYNSIKSYKLDIKPAEYSLRNIPELKTEDKMFKRKSSVISVLADDYWKMGFLSDYFNEEVRVRGKRSDAKESPFDYWTHNREAVINEMREKKMLLTIKEVNEFLYTKNIGCNTFKPYLLVGIAKYFNSTHVLDFSSGWGDRLIGALAAGISYVGVDPNDELFEGYKKILLRFGNGRLIADNPLTYENDWNMYKMICAPFQQADLQHYTCDLIFTSPPYFDLEIYSDKPTQSVQEFPDVSDWETGFLYVSLAKAWDRLRPFGYLVLIMNNIFGKPDFTRKAVDWATKNLPDAEYLGLLPYAHMGYNRSWKSPQPMWIWQKKSDVKLNDIYYIGNERCEKIECKDFAELETIIGHKVKRTDTDENCIYLGDEESSQNLDYGTITINNSQFKIKKYVNLTKEGLNPKIEVQEITTLPNKTLRLICDHLLPGGTKQRGVDFSSITADEVVYAGPYVGYAQIAMAIGGKLYGKRTTVFLSKNDYYATLRAMQYGCQVKLVHEAPLKVLQEQARTYAKETNSHLLEFGFDTDDFKEELFRNITSSIEGVIPTAEITNTIWVVAGSATLLRVLYRVFPNAKFGVVQVGKTIWPDQMEQNRTKLYVAKEDFYESARELPPYKSAIRYDAKAWQFIREHAADGDLIWNVAS